MNERRWLLHVLVLLATAGAGLGRGSVVAAEVVTVSLISGRQITGELDARTNDQQVWLHFAAENISIRRSIPWMTIDTVRHNATTLNKSQVLTLADQNNESSDAPSAVATGMESGDVNAVEAEPAAGVRSSKTLLPVERDAAVPIHIGSSFGGPVRSIQFDAEPANWDADVELDGLLVHLLPLDAYAQVIPVRGTLEAELFVTRRRGFLVVPNRRGTTPERIGRWSLPLHVHQVTADGALVQLPFQNIRPEFETDWSNLGLLHIRCVIPGHGVFESSLDGVPLRPVTPIRDTLERFGGDRFLPTEQTGVSLPIGR